MEMVILSSILTVISFTLLIMSFKDIIMISRYNYVTGKLIQVDLAANSSSKIYEATYRYKINESTKIFISNHRHKNEKHFKETIKLYYKNNKIEVFEMPTMELIVLSFIALVICSISTVIFILIL